MKPVNGGAVRRNTTIEFELADGRTVPLTLTWSLLMQVSCANKDLYRRFSKAMVGGELTESIVDMATSIYVSYLCGYAQENGGFDGCMAERDFIDLVPMDLTATFHAIKELLFPKAGEDSGERS